MSTIPDNNSTSNQNELDFGLEQGDAVAPRKAQSTEPSFLNRLFGKKDTPRINQFSVRKEPTFGATVDGEISPKMANDRVSFSTETTSESNAVSQQEQSTVQQHISVEDSVYTDPVLTQSDAQSGEESQNEAVTETSQINDEVSENKSKFSLKNPENWSVMQKLPQKHRRLFVSIVAAVAVLIVLLLLKPSNDTVEDFQAANNSNSMPIEFQSLDPNQPVEDPNLVNSVQVNDNHAEVQTAPMSDNNAVQSTTTETVAAPEQPAPVAEPNTAPQAVAPEATQQVQTQAEQSQAEQARIAEQAKLAEQARQEKLAKAQKEKAEKARAEKAKAEQKAKAEKAKAEEKAKQATERARAQAALNGAPISESKPAKNAKNTATKGASKTLVIPASTSLFQVFRNNNLDIRDVNAMTKAKGVGNALNSFNAGDKVQVATNSEGRVTTLRLPNGGVFTRQNDGSYKFSK